MSSPFHRAVTGTSAFVVALSTVRIADNLEEFLLNIRSRISKLEENATRLTEGIERGMNKYAPPPKGVKTP